MSTFTGRRTTRAMIAGLIAGAGLLVVGSTAAHANSYPPDTGATSELNAEFVSLCMNDVPYIEYKIVPLDGRSTGPAQLTVRDTDGNVVQTVDVKDLWGRIIYPGAAAGANGLATDWPGWASSGGTFVRDASDADLLLGLGITVEVAGYPPITGQVSYVNFTMPCAAPQVVLPAAPSPTGQLPQTGGDGVSSVLIMAGLALAAGVVLTIVATRRRRDNQFADA